MDLPDLEKALQEKYLPEQLQEKISHKIKDFQYLLTRETALKLIASEEGLLALEDRARKIADIRSGERGIRLEAVVERVMSGRRFPSGNRSRSLWLRDESGSMSFTLWNEAVDRLASLKAGDRIRVQKAYCRKGELQLSSKGTWELLETAPFIPLQQAALAQGPVTVRGTIKSMKENVFRLQDATIGLTCVVDAGPERTVRFEAGDELVLEHVFPRNGELHIGLHSRLLLRKKIDRRETVLGTEAQGEILAVRLEKGDLQLPRAVALRWMGVEAAPDIALSTVATLKKDSGVHTRIDRSEWG